MTIQTTQDTETHRRYIIDYEPALLHHAGDGEPHFTDE